MSLRCACLLDVRDQELLLVRVRDNELWYLPGGTVEAGEALEDALIREVQEELGIALVRASIEHRITVVGPALGRSGDVELNCFVARWSGQAEPRAEISELDYVPLTRTSVMAPAVRKLVRQLEVAKSGVAA